MKFVHTRAAPSGLDACLCEALSPVLSASASVGGSHRKLQGAFPETALNVTCRVRAAFLQHACLQSWQRQAAASAAQSALHRQHQQRQERIQRFAEVGHAGTFQPDARTNTRQSCDRWGAHVMPSCCLTCRHGFSLCAPRAIARTVSLRQLGPTLPAHQVPLASHAATRPSARGLTQSRQLQRAYYCQLRPAQGEASALPSTSLRTASGWRSTPRVVARQQAQALWDAARQPALRLGCQPTCHPSRQPPLPAQWPEGVLRQSHLLPRLWRAVGMHSPAPAAWHQRDHGSSIRVPLSLVLMLLAPAVVVPAALSMTAVVSRSPAPLPLPRSAARLRNLQRCLPASRLPTHNRQNLVRKPTACHLPS